MLLNDKNSSAIRMVDDLDFDIINMGENITMDVLLFFNIMCLVFAAFNIRTIYKSNKKERESFKKGKILAANHFLFIIILSMN